MERVDILVYPLACVRQFPTAFLLAGYFSDQGSLLFLIGDSVFRCYGQLNYFTETLRVIIFIIINELINLLLSTLIIGRSRYSGQVLWYFNAN